MKHIIVGTAGHIDHGKSALVKALTGTDPDRLKEEKLRGITIDLGFAHLDEGSVEFGFVDVPGHEKFVKNMLAGVGGIDCVLLVVAADESVMPQTREHFDICRLLGIQTGIVVITKTDVTEAELIELVRDDIRDLVAGSFLEDAPVMPVSSRTGDGLAQLREELVKVATRIPERPHDRPLRLPIDRAFTMRGFGTVVTGTLISGELRREDEVELIPGGIITRVRGLQVHGSMTDRAVAGQRTAVNLQGLDLQDVARGMVLTEPHLFRPSGVLDVSLSLLPGAPVLRSLRKVRFHQGTSEILARVALIGTDALAPGESAFAQLRLDSPVFCLHGDCFIVRQFSPPVTIGGGILLDPHPVKHRSTDSAVRERLKVLSGTDLAAKIPVLLASSERAWLDIHELNSRLGIPEGSLAKACRQLASRGSLVFTSGPSPLLVAAGLVSELQIRTIRLVQEFHESQPLLRGIPREELRNRVFRDLDPEVFRHCLDSLVMAKKIALHDDSVSLHGRVVRLSENEVQLKSQIEAVYLSAGYQPPLLAEVTAAVGAAPEDVRRIYFWMLKDKQLIKISDELAYLRSTLEDIKSRIRERYASGAQFGVAEFKELFDLTRKHAIPLLEYLDRERFTRRQGNDRVLL